jgi:hypothetical protein
LGAAFLLLRLRDFLRRLADFLLGAAFLRDARRRLFGAMIGTVFVLDGNETRETDATNRRDQEPTPVCNKYFTWYYRACASLEMTHW